ncbi:hypothetical protein A6A04_11560 [Paramagnetospirillum marisnigri]|uniref:DUF2254 domain-containing protein n=1 Tax=Paramagnetospirillum marisnigri TaxID=1285242 RepID=A0A178MZ43_9PROT|nr:hypothetical protein [Paramagnetospirillum marisnigri]OAN55285.1 hypothetical protein A6A04_11560 [Paramagnetospirillum marisnigri]
MVILERNIRSRLAPYWATISILICAAIFAAWMPMEWGNYKAVEIGIGLGGALATVLALALTLSVIPIQRAADHFSASIIHLYAKDKTFRLAFGTLVAAVVLAFMSGSGLFTLRPRMLFVVQAVLLGSGVDCLRAFYWRFLTLLDPANAPRILTRQAAQAIQWADREVRRCAFVEGLDPNGPNLDDRYRRAGIYFRASALLDPVRRWNKDLLEMAAKALERREQSTVAEIFSGLGSIAVFYLNIKKESSFGQDEDHIVNPIYEGIMTVSNQAAALGMEETCQNAIKVLGTIAANTAQITVSSGRIVKAPYIYMPLSYMDRCAETALQKKMQDAGLETIRMCRLVLAHIPEAYDTHAVDASLIDVAAKVAAAGYGMGSWVVANTAADAIVEIAMAELGRERYRRAVLLSKAFYYLEFLLPFAIASSTKVGLMAGSFPPYASTSNHSLASLIQTACSLIPGHDPEHPRRDRLTRFSEVCEATAKHLSDVASKVDFSSSLVMADLIMVLDEIFKTLRQQLESLDPKLSEDENETFDKLASQFIWASGCFWGRDKINAAPGMADEVARMLSAHAVAFVRLGHIDLATQVAHVIRRIAGNIANLSLNSIYDVADVTAQLWPIKMAGDLAAPELSAIAANLIAAPYGVDPKDEGEIHRVIALRGQQMDTPSRRSGYEGMMFPDPMAELYDLKRQMNPDAPPEEEDLDDFWP